MLGVHHPLLKSIRKAVQRGARTDDGFAIAEGFHLLREAIRTGATIGAIVATPRAAEKLDNTDGLQFFMNSRKTDSAAAGVGREFVAGEEPRPAFALFMNSRKTDSAAAEMGPEFAVGGGPRPAFALIDEATLHGFSSVENSQGIISLIQIDEQPIAHCLTDNTLVVALDGIQDPGNAGAIVRAAEAFGASGAVFLKGTVSPWNPKTLRASAGSLLRLPFAVTNWERFLAEIEDRHIPLYAADPRAGKRADEVPLHQPAILLVGNEGNGIPAAHEPFATAIRIPTQNVESLNAALAAGILLYEACRQRS